MNQSSLVPLSDLLTRSNEPAVLDSEHEYREVTVKLWGKGVVSRGVVRGAEVVTNRRVVRSGQIILSKIDARNGAIGIVPPELDRAIVSNDFPSFNMSKEEKLCPSYMGWLVQSRWFARLCKSASEGTTNRVRIKESKFLEQKIPLPSLAKQQAIAACLDALADKTCQLTAHIDTIEADANHLLAQRFQRAIAGAPYRPMAEVAPLVRREVAIDPEASYPELGVRSFGKGTFHKPALSGLEVGTKRLFRIEPGDLLLSNVFAWEGAVAIAKPEDTRRVGSHRFMSCVVDPRLVLPAFLLYYLLSPEGMEKVQAASPGGAGRNRTLGVKKLERIEVPVPPLSSQQRFVELQAAVAALKRRHTALRESNTALLPATLDRLFAGDRNP